MKEEDRNWVFDTFEESKLKQANALVQTVLSGDFITARVLAQSIVHDDEIFDEVAQLMFKERWLTLDEIKAHIAKRTKEKRYPEAPTAWARLLKDES